MTPLLKTSGWYVWSGDTKASSAAWGFNFRLGPRGWYGRSDPNYREFVVRSRL